MDERIYKETIRELIKKLDEYQAIGTPEECRDSRERQEKKKPILDAIYQQQYYCPSCSEFLCRKHEDKPHHCVCGQAIDWGE